MVWWCRSAFVTTKSVFSYVLSQMGAVLSEAGKAKWVCFVCWQHSTWIVFDPWVWQPMSSHVAKVTTWTDLVNLNSGFFDVSVHKYIPRQEGWIRRTMQGTNGLLFFFSPGLSGYEPLLSGARGAEKVFPFYVVFETPSYMSRLCRKSLRGVPPQSHCTSGFSVPICI